MSKHHPTCPDVQRDHDFVRNHAPQGYSYHGFNDKRDCTFYHEPTDTTIPCSPDHMDLLHAILAAGRAAGRARIVKWLRERAETIANLRIGIPHDPADEVALRAAADALERGQG